MTVDLRIRRGFRWGRDIEEYVGLQATTAVHLPTKS